MPEGRHSSPLKVAERAALWTAIGIGLGLAVVDVAPHSLGLWSTYPFVQLEALPLGWITALLLLVWMASLLRRHGNHRKSVRTRIAQVSILLLVVAILAELILFARAGGFIPAHQATVHAERRDFTVLSFNARHSEAVDIVEAAVRVRADILLLVEVDTEITTKIAESLHQRGLPNQLFTDSEKSDDRDATAIVASTYMGQYRQLAGPNLVFGSVSVVPVNGSRTRIGNSSFTSPPLSVVHPPPPIPGKYSSEVWRLQLHRSVQECRPGEATIVGGDFNSSTTHITRLVDKGCIDAAKHLGRGAVGTWPRSLPAPFGASIDHQIVDIRHWVPVGIQYLDIGGSDHRALAVSYRSVAP